MSIKTRVSLTLFAVVLLLTYLQSTVLRHAIAPSFEKLELDLARRELRLPEDAIENEVEHLSSLARDWARRDEILGLARGPDSAQALATLPWSALPQNQLVAIQIVDREGRIARSLRAAPRGFESTTLAAIPDSPGLLSHSLLVDPLKPVPSEGLLATAWGPLLVSSQPLLAERDSGACIGTLLVARVVDDTLVARISAQTNVSFSLLGVDDADRNPQLAQTLTSLRAGESAVFEALTDEVLTGSSLLRDVKGQDTLLLRARIPRSVTAHGAYAFDVAFLLGFAGELLVLMTLYIVLHLGVVRPLLEFTRRVVLLREGSIAPDSLALGRNDEIGILSREFAALYASLQEFQRKAVESSRMAGMSEVATNVLHNVGNMLNSVNVTTSVIRTKVGQLSSNDLKKLAGRMADLGDDLARWIEEDPGGKQMPAYLEAMAAEMEAARSTVESECSALGVQIQEIGALISDQQQLAKPGGYEEEVDLVERTRLALRIAIADDDDIEIRRGNWEPLLAHSDGHKLLQILVNLIKNAAESYDSMEVDRRWVEITISRAEGGARISVSDGGCGIAHEHLQTIFQHGFSTKADGHGFGLHSAATSAQELKGRLCASSAGSGLGSTFVLELPLEGVDSQARAA